MRLLMIGALAALQIMPTSATSAQSAPGAVIPSSTPDLTRTKITIPYQIYRLANGLRVLVHTDRSAPVVAVSVWYNVGSKQEPAGKTGFAHLFEHLMFGGSENSRKSFIDAITGTGATRINGTTNYDRTNYYETVPRGALERALYLESDRMGYFLGAVDQNRLDTQRGVVQNEKRQGDNQPLGMTRYYQTAALFPASHPYGHDTIGSMADLDSASLQDIRAWFREHYGPNNAVLVLAGDIDGLTAKRLATKYFGSIPRGPVTKPVVAPLPTLSSPKTETITDNVPNTTIIRDWVGPGPSDPDAVPLAIGARVLGGFDTARLYDVLVRKEGLAVKAQARLYQYAQLSAFEVTVVVKPGVDPDRVRHRLDTLIAEYIAEGPDAADVRSAVAQYVSGSAQSLESLTWKAEQLAEGLLYFNDPGRFSKELTEYTASTAADVRRALQKWLGRPAYTLNVVPGRRAAYVEAAGSAAAPGSGAPAISTAKRPPAPPLADTIAPPFPAVSRVRLSNGIEISYIHRGVAPITQLEVSFDAGAMTDPFGKEGLTKLTTSLLSRGTATKDAKLFARSAQQLGAFIRADSTGDRIMVDLSSLSAAAAPSLDLLADMLRQPAFAFSEVELGRDGQMDLVKGQLTDPGAMAFRVLEPAILGRNNPRGRPWFGTTDSVQSLTRADVINQYRTWLRPEMAKIFVVSDLPLTTLQPLLEHYFGGWRGEGAPGSKENASTLAPESPGRILLVDRKDSPQSYILGGVAMPRRAADATLSLDLASQVLANGFLSRLNTNIREKKGWAYGVRGGVFETPDLLFYEVATSAQADKTGATLAAMIGDSRSFVSGRGVTSAELARTRDSNLRKLAGLFTSGFSIMSTMAEIDRLGLGDDYYSNLPRLLRDQSAKKLDDAAQTALDPARMIWVVVGDADKVRPQLESLNLPVEIRTVK